MDPRVRDHARVLVDHSTDVSEGDNVVVTGQAPAEDLLVAINELCGERGATTFTTLGPSERARRAYLRAVDEDDVETNELALALFEAADVVIQVQAPANAAETSDVPPAKTQARAAVQQPVQEAVLETRWCLTEYPTPAGAQRAEMSTGAYEDFVFDAVNKDWDAVEARQRQLVELLDGADEVRIRSGDDTELALSIAGNVVQNDAGETNMPGGEVFTAPVPDSVEGEVVFDLPVIEQGREIIDARLVFEGGEVVEHGAAKNGDVLTSVLETDEGARRVGELGIGMNRDIDRFTANMLFDEKMGDTVHLAVGMAYEDTVGEDNERNESVVHTDMLVDVSEDSVIEVDGEVIQRNGTFRWEDGFGE